MNVEIGRQNIIILFWKKRGQVVSYLGIHQSEHLLYIGFSPALHLQCMSCALIWNTETYIAKEHVTCSIIYTSTDTACDIGLPLIILLLSLIFYILISWSYTCLNSKCFQGPKDSLLKVVRNLPVLTLIRMTKDEKGLAFFKGLLL